MSGVFREEQNVAIESTDDPELAKRYGLTQFDKATGLYTAPTPPDAGQRDGADVQEQRRIDALAEGDAQQQAEDAERVRQLGGEGQDVTLTDERTPGAPNVAGEVTATADVPEPAVTTDEPAADSTADDAGAKSRTTKTSSKTSK